ncbi:hypothetical protein LCGC14_0738490, partial [marine sediment metagenome]
DNDKLLFEVKVTINSIDLWLTCKGERRYVVEASNTLEASNMVRLLLDKIDWVEYHLVWRITSTIPLSFKNNIAEIY